MLGLGTQELVVVAILALLLFGGQKIPELMRGLGKGLGELKQGIEEAKRPLVEALHSEDEKR